VSESTVYLRRRRPRIAVHKFSSCDGCQLAFLNLGEDLIALNDLVDIVHFVEAGLVDPDADVDIAFVEGSISTPEELERIKRVRDRSRFLVPIGACATSGGPQALRNLADAHEWIRRVYPHPEHISSLDTATPIASNVRVDLQLWGCPVSGRQVLGAVRALLFGAPPVEENEKVCMECKRRQHVCVLVAEGAPCMGPVTRTGCGALCPGLGRDCYGCYGPAENVNTRALVGRFRDLGLSAREARRRFMLQNSGAPAFHAEAADRRGEGNG
jgi:sulfhydrogenase subunit delta